MFERGISNAKIFNESIDSAMRITFFRIHLPWSCHCALQRLKNGHTMSHHVTPCSVASHHRDVSQNNYKALKITWDQNSRFCNSWWKRAIVARPRLSSKMWGRKATTHVRPCDVTRHTKIGRKIGTWLVTSHVEATLDELFHVAWNVLCWDVKSQSSPCRLWSDSEISPSFKNVEKNCQQSRRLLTVGPPIVVVQKLFHLLHGLTPRLRTQISVRSLSKQRNNETRRTRSTRQDVHVKGTWDFGSLRIPSDPFGSLRIPSMFWDPHFDQIQGLCEPGHHVFNISLFKQTSFFSHLF